MRVGSGTHTYEAAAPWILDIKGPNTEVVGVAVNSADEVHVLTRSPHPVLVFSTRGRFLRSWGEGVFSLPHGIHIAPDDTIFIADNMDSTVRKFSPIGELLLTLGTKDRPSNTGYRDEDYRTIRRSAPPFCEPTNVAVSPTGEFYISDGYGNARVHRFSETGALLGSWGEPGDGPGQFNIPHGIFVNSAGTVFVADRENNRIQLFSASGEYIDAWLDFRRPDDIFVTPDNSVFVAEQGLRSGLVPGMPSPSAKTPASRVTVRSSKGDILSVWGSDENADSTDPCASGNFFAAHGIWVDRYNTVYVGEVNHLGSDPNGPPAGRVPPNCHALQVFTMV